MANKENTCFWTLKILKIFFKRYYDIHEQVSGKDLP